MASPKTRKASGTPIQIDLEKSSDTREFALEKNELIHADEFQQITTLIAEETKAAQDEAKEEEAKQKRNEPFKRKYIHHTITVLGTRGSGKTSFLLSLKQKYDRDTHVQVLDILDPTLIEEKGHVFLHVIALITELVEKKLAASDAMAEKDNRPIRRAWRDHILGLAAGLPSIDGVGAETLEHWQEPEFIMDKGLLAVKAAKNLADNFFALLKAALEILEKDTFLLFFDDIDVDTRKGLAVLETIRKYLTNTRMITVLSGDLKLYSLAIRQQKWKNFGKELMKYEGLEMKDIDRLNNLVTELSGQYLLKVMQPRYRVHLTTLLEKMNKAKEFTVEVIAAENSLGRKRGIKDVYSHVVRNFGVRNTAQQELYITFLLGLPLRTQIQFLYTLSKLLGEDEKSNEPISDVFLADLLEKNVNVTLAINTPKYYCSILLELMLDEHALLDLYQMQPATTDSTMNGTVMALWMLLSQFLKSGNAYLLFDYFIKIAYIRNLLTLIPYHDREDRREIGAYPSVEDLCELADVFNDGVLRDVTSAIQAYVLGALEKEGSPAPATPYYITLMGLGRRAKHKLADRIDIVLEKKNKATRILGNIPCFNATYSYKNESRVLYSIHVLIGTIGELVKLYEIVPELNRKNVIAEALNQLSQFRSYLIPDFRSRNFGSPSWTDTSSDEEEAEDPTINIRETQTDPSEELLIEHILTWIKNKPSTALSAHQLGKSYTRFYYAMNNISEAIPGKRHIGLGELFHHQVTAFMNAVLVEDAIEDMKGDYLNINNTRLNDGVFIANLRALNKLGAKELTDFNLSRWILTCPLLIAYLSPKKSSLFRKDLDRFCAAKLDHSYFSYDIAAELDKVRTAYQKREHRTRKKEAEILVEGAPDLLAQPKALIRKLKRSGVPKTLFQHSTNRATVRQRNEAIRTSLGSIFGEGDDPPHIVRARINRFRKYLKDNPGAWQ